MMQEECDGMQKVVESLRKQKEINQQTIAKYVHVCTRKILYDY